MHTRFCPLTGHEHNRCFSTQNNFNGHNYIPDGMLLHRIHYLLILLSTEKNGKTLHLLKAKSKATPAGKKRKKVALLGSFESYKDSKK